MQSGDFLSDQTIPVTPGGPGAGGRPEVHGCGTAAGAALFTESEGTGDHTALRAQSALLPSSRRPSGTRLRGVSTVCRAPRGRRGSGLHHPQGPCGVLFGFSLEAIDQVGQVQES